ncbi:hypothetical protein [Glaciecola sp. SC05]|uniref:hypothetical protein n=1 Tax=Glaciecola sp. SC05 TaxID=1987355 RepID=UPI003527D8FF
MSVNENHRAKIEIAFREYLNSDYFQGHVYPGQFYEFCKQKREFEKINHTLCNRVQLSVERLAMRVDASFRRNAPLDSTVNQAKQYLKIALECTENTTNLSRELRTCLGDKFGDFTKYLPVKTIEYMHSIGLKPNELPALVRDDYPKFFRKMQMEGYQKTSQYVEYMRNETIPLPLRETVQQDESGFLYCFISNHAARTKGYVVVKIGRTKRALSRILSHKSSWDEHRVMLLAYTSAVKNNEEKLIAHFESDPLTISFYDPKTKRKSPELFEIPALYANKLFADFLESLG